MKCKRGFSLIELVIMIAVASALLVGMGRAVQGQIATATKNRDYMIALNLAKKQMATMNLAAYPATAVEAALAADASFPDFIPTQEVSANIATSGANSIRRITVRVRIKSLAGAVLVMLDTYRSNIITFGNGS